ncbi:MAG: valine--tRNA ligase [Gemmatimonadales bacterium]|nr:MAG: valine--tRNA ligase [Gemmatimonadales bacterium]
MTPPRPESVTEPSAEPVSTPGPDLSAGALPPRLDPAAIEKPLYARALERGLFHESPGAVLDEGVDPYAIVIPPPNVTAVLHMGHGLNNTVQDVLIRWRRMEGRAALWVPGTDHAGIATQNVVERILREGGQTRFDLGRDAFVERVWAFVGETGGTILEQLKAIGASCDWERTAFTLDPGLSRAVREVFVRLYEKGLIYRGEYIINWCPRCGTALSNEEAEGQEVDGHLHSLRYPLPEASWPAAAAARDAGATAVGRFEEGKGWYLTVSTTRPETMLGDTGVAVHPGDTRYAALVGVEVELPLTGRRIPVVADDWVDPEFGTGMVKVTPAHDPNDFEIARRTGLEVLNVLTPEAILNESAPERFRGMDRFQARKAVVAALREEGLFAGQDPHRHSVPHCYRCDTVVEPRLSEQWFVRMKPLAEPALAASRDGTIRFHPSHWTKVYEEWMENIRDWCISRQLWWGHRIPVWYCRNPVCGEMSASREDLTACPICGSEKVEQDPDVLDTWFSSWLWPFSVFGWPEETEDLKAFYPGHTLVTAPEILFFWVARMIMAGYEFQGEAPFRDVFLHGTVRDAKGRKMSKSLGNGIDPMEVVEQFGADALRYTVLSMCGVGTDIHLDHEDLEGAFAPGRNFANKLWNAGRFTLMSVGEGPVKPLSEVEEALETADRWILSRFSRSASAMTDGLERFRIHDVVDRGHHLFWGDFADWYLEVVKGRLRGEEGEASREAARSVLVHVFDGILRLLHPLVPFVTEYLWDRIPWPEASDRPEALPLAPWPAGDPARVDPEAEADFAALQELVTVVRSLRKEYGVGEGAPVTLALTGAPERFQTAVAAEAPRLWQLARVKEVEFSGGGGAGVGATAILQNGSQVFLPLEGLVDLEQERARLRKEIQRLDGQLVGAEKKLANEQFIGRAPAEVVAKEREKAAVFRDQRDKLQEKLQVLEAE